MIRTERLDIKRSTLIEDWKRIHIYGADPEFSKYDVCSPNSEEETQKFVRDVMLEAQEDSPRYRFEFAVCLKEDGLLIGGAGVRREAQESSVGHLGWAINPQFQRKRVTQTEAGARLDRLWFQRARLIRNLCDL